MKEEQRVRSFQAKYIVKTLMRLSKIPRLLAAHGKFIAEIIRYRKEINV